MAERDASDTTKDQHNNCKYRNKKFNLNTVICNHPVTLITSLFLTLKDEIMYEIK